MSMAELVPGGVPWTEEDDDPTSGTGSFPAQLARYHAWQDANVVPFGDPSYSQGVTLELPDGTILRGTVSGNQDDDE
jgi:hypothetical protein